MNVSPLNSAIAGMYANAAKLAAAAHNIANVNTDGFKKSYAVIESSASGQPDITLSLSGTPGSIVQAGEGLPEGDTTRELSNVDMADELIQMRIAEYGYRSNFSVIRTQDEMIGTVLDIIA